MTDWPDLIAKAFTAVGAGAIVLPTIVIAAREASKQIGPSRWNGPIWQNLPRMLVFSGFLGIGLLVLCGLIAVRPSIARIFFLLATLTVGFALLSVISDKIHERQKTPAPSNYYWEFLWICFESIFLMLGAIVDLMHIILA